MAGGDHWQPTFSFADSMVTGYRMTTVNLATIHPHTTASCNAHFP